MVSLPDKSHRRGMLGEYVGKRVEEHVVAMGKEKGGRSAGGG